VKKIAAIILLLCFFFTVIGYHFLFYIQLSEIKAEMKGSLHLFPSKEIVEFSFNEKELANLQWENNDEFELNNEMYDVITRHPQDSKFLIRCIPDKKEKALVEAYQKIHRKNSGSPVQNALIKLIAADFLAVQYKAILCPQRELKSTFLNYQSALFFIALYVLKHPPRCC
jgi:hypothetical protein